MNDLISRKYLLECVEEGWVMFDTERDKNLYIHLVRDIAPSKEGRWIPFTSEVAGDIWYCSACGVGFAHHMDFCPHCGADMREEEP